MARVIPASGRMRVPIVVWARDARAEAFALLERVAAQPYVFGHVAAMPDLHAAGGVAVGTVYFGRRLWVHRKGAIAAPAGAPVLIPGSMGTASYLAEGLGEATSFRSASHGAGRILTRREARERIRPERLARSMARVVHDARRSRALVEEAPAAYRDVRAVLDDEAELVRPRVRLEPMVVLKG